MDAFENDTPLGDEVARVAGIGTIYRIWLQNIGESNTRYAVTVTSGPGAMRTDSAMESAIGHTTPDASSKSWADAMAFVLTRTTYEALVEERG